MKQVEEQSRSTPVMAETDVLVIGTGPGRLAAVSTKDGVMCSEANIERLQHALRKQGVRLF